MTALEVFPRSVEFERALWPADGKTWPTSTGYARCYVVGYTGGTSKIGMSGNVPARLVSLQREAAAWGFSIWAVAISEPLTVDQARSLESSVRGTSPREYLPDPFERTVSRAETVIVDAAADTTAQVERTSRFTQQLRNDLAAPLAEMQLINRAFRQLALLPPHVAEEIEVCPWCGASRCGPPTLVHPPTCIWGASVRYLQAEATYRPFHVFLASTPGAGQ